jgi:putative transposase
MTGCLDGYISNDPFFVEKLRDVVGLYLSPPENAL